MNHSVTTNPPNFAQKLNIRIGELSIPDITALSPEELQELQITLLEIQTNIKAALDRFHAALDQRYGDQASAIRLKTGKDFGICHFTDGPLQVTVDLPKRVSWDQFQLSTIATRIADSGEKVSDFIDIEFSISESRYNNWPTSLKEQFNDARTVKSGKASYRLALINTKGESA
jgi:hypothetical protein